VEKIPKKLLKNDLWQRAARHFGKAGRPSESAAAWLAAGHDEEAISALIQAGDRTQATPLLLKAKRYKEATEQAHLWLKELAQEPRRQAEEKIRARLILAAALHLDHQPDQAHAAYDTAREELTQGTKKSPPLTNGRNWEALAAYGVRVKRPDLIRLGYEKALTAYGQTFNLQRLRCAGEYLENISEDFHLTKELKERLAGWQPQSSMKRERERLWEALAKFTGEEN